MLFNTLQAALQEGSVWHIEFEMWLEYWQRVGSINWLVEVVWQAKAELAARFVWLAEHICFNSYNMC